MGGGGQLGGNGSLHGLGWGLTLPVHELGFSGTLGFVKQHCMLGHVVG